MKGEKALKEVGEGRSDGLSSGEALQISDLVYPRPS